MTENNDYYQLSKDFYRFILFSCSLFLVAINSEPRTTLKCLLISLICNFLCDKAFNIWRTLSLSDLTPKGI